MLLQESLKSWCNCRPLWYLHISCGGLKLHNATRRVEKEICRPGGYDSIWILSRVLCSSRGLSLCCKLLSGILHWWDTSVTFLKWINKMCKPASNPCWHIRTDYRIHSHVSQNTQRQCEIPAVLTCHSPSFSSFVTALKTHLFKHAFDPLPPPPHPLLRLSIFFSLYISSAFGYPF